MISKISQSFVRVSERYMPDPFVLVMILTVIVFGTAIFFESQPPLVVVEMWGDGLWSLLAFSMQMVLILITGFMLADTPLVRNLLRSLAGVAKTPGQAIVLVSSVSLAIFFLNWGFALVAGPILAREVARKICVDYRLLIASAYSGILVVNGGISSAIPLSMATPGHPFESLLGIVPTSATIFSPFSLALVATVGVCVVVLNRLMLPVPTESYYVELSKLDAPPPEEDVIERPADVIETNPALPFLVGALGLAYVVQNLATGGTLTINLIILLFLSLAILLHKTPRRLLASLRRAINGAAPIVIQYPFYAGIMAVMAGSGLAQSLSDGLVSFANETTFPALVFLSAGVLNIFVPSAGGQWAVQAPIVLAAAEQLGVDLARTSLAVAWGDAWTNMIQPFWALPALTIAGLKAKDIMGFCVLHLFVSGAIIVVFLTFL